MNNVKIELDKIIQDLFLTIDDDMIKNIISKNTIILGGAIASLIQNEIPNDYDIYFKNKPSLNTVCDYFCRNTLFCAFETDNAITITIANVQYQFIKKIYGKKEYIIEHFDFLHCMASYDLEFKYLEISNGVLRCIIDKRLIYVGNKYPIKALIRISKFIKRNYTIEIKEYFKIIFQIKRLELENFDIFKNQVEGVYYFSNDEDIEELFQLSELGK